MRFPARNSLIAALVFFATPVLLGQQVHRPEIDLAAFIEEMFPVQDDDILYEDLYESLFQLYSNPLNINTATFEELSSLYTLSPAQVESIISYRQLNGPLLSLYELQAVPLLDVGTIEKVLPFITLSQTSGSRQSLWKRIATEENNYLILRTERTLQLPKGYSRADKDAPNDHQGYFGGPLKHYARLRVSHAGDFSLGFTMEKDAGERLRWNPGSKQFGFDYYSLHAEIKNKGRLKSLNIGDYQLQTGQGLVFGAGFAPGKGAETILTVKRNSLGLRPYTSVLETGFFRGAAATYQLGRWEITTLASRLNQDGTVQSDSLNDSQEPFHFVSSILNTGFHRTPSELAGKDQVAELNTGGTVAYKGTTFQAGLNTLYTHFNTYLEKRPTLANRFEFAGTNNFVNSLHFSKLWQNAQLFGEAARSSSGGLGALGGVLLSINKSIGVSVVGRSYDRDFHSFYARAFGENSRNINEKGIYWGIKWAPVRQLQFTAYYDRFSFPWLRFNADMPTDGHEYMSMISYRLNKMSRFNVQYRQQVKATNGDINDWNVRVPVDGKKENVVLSLEHEGSDLISFKSRIQMSRYTQNSQSSNGYALVQDVNFKWKALKIGARLAVFDTEDSNNRQYVYEKDVLYAFSIPSYSGTGIRSYLLFQYKLTPKSTLWIRWSQFSYHDTEAIGTGLQEIQGPIKNDLKVQVMIRPF